MMVETVVDPMSTQTTAMIANALIPMEAAGEEEIPLHQLLQVPKPTCFEGKGYVSISLPMFFLFLLMLIVVLDFYL